MEQAPTTPTTDAQPSALSNSWDAWDNYYKQASRRRRASGGSRQIREDKRRRRIRERIGLAISAALVGGLMLIFYMVLTRR
jgi:hypothetical protein